MRNSHGQKLGFALGILALLILLAIFKYFQTSMGMSHPEQFVGKAYYCVGSSDMAAKDEESCKALQQSLSASNQKEIDAMVASGAVVDIHQGIAPGGDLAVEVLAGVKNDRGKPLFKVSVKGGSFDGQKWWVPADEVNLSRLYVPGQGSSYSSPRKG